MSVLNYVLLVVLSVSSIKGNALSGLGVSTVLPKILNAATTCASEIQQTITPDKYRGPHKRSFMKEYDTFNVSAKDEHMGKLLARTNLMIDDRYVSIFVKQNKRGRFIKINQNLVGRKQANKELLYFTLPTAPRFARLLSKFSDYCSTLGDIKFEAKKRMVDQNMLMTKKMKESFCDYYLNLKESRYGRYLRILEANKLEGANPRLTISVKGMQEVRNILSDFLQEFGRFKKLPEGTYLKIDDREFFFNVTQDIDGEVFLLIREQMYTYYNRPYLVGIEVPQRLWELYSDLIDDYIEKLETFDTEDENVYSQANMYEDNKQEQFRYPQKVYSKAFQTKTKVYYFYCKVIYNRHFITISNKYSDIVVTLFFSIAAAQQIVERVHKLVSFQKTLDVHRPENLEDEEKTIVLKSETLASDHRKYFVDLKENIRGRFLAIQEIFTHNPNGVRQQVTVVESEIEDFSSELTKFVKTALRNVRSDERLPRVRSLQTDTKNFYFDIGLNEFGITMRFTEVNRLITRKDIKRELIIFKPTWYKFRDIIRGYCDKMMNTL